MTQRRVAAAAAATGVRSPVWPLAALVLGAFSYGATEFAPMGLLPAMATGLHVSIPTAGGLVSAYAIGVMVSAPLATLALTYVPRKAALLLLMALFSVGNLLTSIAPGYLPVMLARVLTSLGQGPFFGIGAVVAAGLVSESRRASAVSSLFLGLALANIAGVAAATWIGEVAGWRTAFLAIAAVGVASVAALFLTLPSGEAERVGDLRDQLRALIEPRVLVTLATTALGASAMFSLYTYVSPVLTHLTHASTAFVEAMLALIGVGFLVGNALGGRLADWSLDTSLAIALAAICAIMLAMPVALTSELATGVALFAWGVAFFAATPAMQLKVMLSARKAPALASSVNIGAFNLGNAIGAAAGGAALTLGWGYGAIPLVGAALAACACLASILNRSPHERGGGRKRT